jgi:uroporphyrinogen decarboxylase
MELFLDAEVRQALLERFGLADNLERADVRYADKALIALYRFLGYDMLRPPVGGLSITGPKKTATDTAMLPKAAGRGFRDHAHGPIASWQDFERYPWPDPARFDTRMLEWYAANTPDDMCLAGSCHQVFDYTCTLMGLEGLSFALYEQPDLVDAVIERVGGLLLAAAGVYLQCDRVKALFDGDDLGHRTATLVSPQVLAGKILPWHKKIAALAHEHGALYLLHSCGNIAAIMPALIEDVQIDGRHSFEDAIEPVTEAKRRWGQRIALIGGLDVDLLARASPEQVRQRVREILDVCLPGGGYCLGSGNSVTNYIPLDNYLAMLDEGRRYGA